MFCKIYNLTFILMCLWCVQFSRSHSCISFENVVVNVRQQNGPDFNTSLDGCIERQSFKEGVTVTEAYIREQSVPVLARDTVRNMKYLNTFVLYSCTSKVNEIVPSAFRNVPNLKNLQISFCGVKEIPRGVFNLIPKLEVLRIHNNEIDVVLDQAFANLTKLKRIYVNHNKLEYWNREWFTNTTSLLIMNFQYNKIRTLPRLAFASLKKLRQIYFDNNEIATIQKDAFKGIVNLEYLGLRFNRLRSINTDVFPNDLKIRSLLLDANYLNFLPNEVLKKISVQDITIDNNPWKCPCLDRIVYWLYETNGTLRKAEGCTGDDVPVCGYPVVFSKTCIEVEDEQVTKTFIENLKKLKKPMSPGCARID